MQRVLIVDDEPLLVRLLEVNFRSAGFDVRTAVRGADAVEAATADPPDAVVLDLGLPDLPGAEVLRRLREAPGMAVVPVVVLSGTDPDADPDHDYASGVYEYLTKPVDPLRVVEVVRRAIAAG